METQKEPKQKDGKEIILRKNGSKRVRTINLTPSKTDQQYKEDCDTNTIINKFRKTGQITHLAQRQGSFADVSQIPDLLPSLEKLQEAADHFQTLPSKIRTKFNNSIENLVQFLHNPDNTTEAINMGLIPKPEGWLPPKAAANNPAGGVSPAPASAPVIKEEVTTTKT